MKYTIPAALNCPSPRIAAASRRILGPAALLACLLLSGCAKPAAPDPVDDGVTGDEKVIQALDAYDPVYQLDEGGRVISLRLEGTFVIPAVLDEVAKLTELESLSLYGASLTDDNLVKLEGLKKLRCLGLAGTQISDNGLVHLEKLDSLLWLWLPQGKVSERRAEELKQKCSGLTIYFQL